MYNFLERKYFHCDWVQFTNTFLIIFQVEAAYDMLLMQSLSQRRAGKVVNSSIRYADVKPVNTPQMGSMPQWVQGALKNPPVSVESPSARDLGIEAGVYGALAVLTYVNPFR